MSGAKPLAISKQEVWKVHLQVKSNGGAPGVDAESIEIFEQELKGNLYRLWNRMASGTYVPPPVREVVIPSVTGAKKLGIPTVTIGSPRRGEAVLGEGRAELSRGLVRVSAGEVCGRCGRPGPGTVLAVRLGARPRHPGLLRHPRSRPRQAGGAEVYRLSVGSPLRGAVAHGSDRTGGWHADGAAGRDSTGGRREPAAREYLPASGFDTWMRRRSPRCRSSGTRTIFSCTAGPGAGRTGSAGGAGAARAMQAGVHPSKTKIVYCQDSNRRASYPETSFEFLSFTFRPRRARDRRGAYS